MGKHCRIKSQKPHQPKIIMAVFAINDNMMMSRCAAWFMGDDMVCKPVNKWGNLRRKPFNAEHSDTKPRLPRRAYRVGIVARIVEVQHARRPMTDGRV